MAVGGSNSGQTDRTNNITRLISNNMALFNNRKDTADQLMFRTGNVANDESLIEPVIGVSWFAGYDTISERKY